MFLACLAALREPSSSCDTHRLLKNLAFVVLHKLTRKGLRIVTDDPDGLAHFRARNGIRRN